MIGIFNNSKEQETSHGGFSQARKFRILTHCKQSCNINTAKLRFPFQFFVYKALLTGLKTTRTGKQGD